MPKAKTHKGARKRVRVTKTGKIKFRHTFTGHLMSGRSGDRRRGLRRRGVLQSQTETTKILKMLGKARP
ncbi:MAG: 50S ribosomal protein L35 [Planctomycetes bacterium]|nr:50S ribosomal protein L35 [Planctomycetota bacterium]